ncbi:MAG: hypothetical protein GY801_34510 [bacterium]|nr:hypothetical protein [bacterium]
MLSLICIGIPLSGMCQAGTRETEVHPKIGLVLSGVGGDLKEWNDWN